MRISASYKQQLALRQNPRTRVPALVIGKEVSSVPFLIFAYSTYSGLTFLSLFSKLCDSTTIPLAIFHLIASSTFRECCSFPSSSAPSSPSPPPKVAAATLVLFSHTPTGTKIMPRSPSPSMPTAAPAIYTSISPPPRAMPGSESGLGSE